MRRLLRDNGLSITMFALFLVFLVAQSIAGYQATNSDNEEHRQPRESYREYLTSGGFVEATFENWESEFLQMGAYVLLTAMLIQKGSPESKNPDGDEVDQDPRQQQANPEAPGPVKRGGLILTVYEHSLSLALFGLFLLFFVFHSMQNWQSEFLAVAALAVLGIFLRQRGSPESKPVAAPHAQTGAS
jgi:hypothetical protein